MEIMTMQEVTDDAIECITAHGMPVVEAIDATIAMYDLDGGEARQLIQRLAKEGFKS